MIRPLASAINSKDHLSVFYDIFTDRMKAIDLSILLINMFDTCPDVALPLLADQFHIKGVEGWQFVTTDVQRRNLISNAITIHKFKGTPYSIEKALELVGFPGATFQEGVDHYYDGSINYDGTATYGSEGWARFRVFIPVSDPNLITIENTAIVTSTINEYKPVRCLLVEVVFNCSVTNDLLTKAGDTLITKATENLNHK
jgi:P2-related tail formation protein